MAGAFTIYCGDCSSPILIERRGREWPAADSVIVENCDGKAAAVRCGRCGHLWTRDSQETVNLVESR